MTDGRDIPWLQDMEDIDWWHAWDVTYRDVIILDHNGELAGVYNLTDQQLTEEEYYLELKTLLIDQGELVP